MSGAHIAAHVAIQKKRQKQEEEEERMTGYTNSDLNDEWEFKIVRSVTSEFNKSAVFQQLLEEEALSNWELLEKLDDGRVRFKRPVSARRKDLMLPPEIDPYRTQYGLSEGGLALRIILVVALLITVVVTIVSLAESGVLF